MPEEIADIVNSRKIHKARQVLSKKYNVSEKRIMNVWREYYGGHTLKDCVNGLIKPLPDTKQKLAGDSAYRKTKGKRGEYSVPEPKVKHEDPPKAKAKTRRVLLNKPESLDQEAIEVLEGEIGAGNDSQDIKMALAELAGQNRMLSEAALESIKAIKATAKNSRRANIETDDETDADDDSTAAYRPAAKPNRGGDRRRSVRRPEVLMEESYESSDETGSDGLWDNTADIRPARRVQPNKGSSELRGKSRREPTANPRRAIPVSATGPGYDESISSEESDDINEVSRPGPQVQRAKPNSSQGHAKPNSSRNCDKLDKGSKKRITAPSEGRVGSGQTQPPIPEFPWLKRI